MTSSRCGKETASCVRNQLDSAASTLATRWSALLHMAQRCRLRRAQRQRVCCPSLQGCSKSRHLDAMLSGAAARAWQAAANCAQGAESIVLTTVVLRGRNAVSATSDQAGSRLLSQATRTDVRDLLCTTSVCARPAATLVSAGLARSRLARCLQYPLQVSRLECRRTLGSDVSNMAHP